MTLKEETFEERYGRSPVSRARRAGFLRNVAVALGNWGAPEAVPALSRALHDPDPLVRGHAAWGLGQIGTDGTTSALAAALAKESDEFAREEIRLGLREAAGEG